MAFQGIVTGSAPNDNTGDSLLAGGIKINSNFTELYNLLGNGSTLAVGVVTNTGDASGVTGITTLIQGGNDISVTTNAGISTISYIGAANTSNINANTVNVSGIVTATSFNGSGASLTGVLTALNLNGADGSGLTGITTLIQAGSNISVTTNAGISTIAYTGIANTANINANTVNVSGIVTATSFSGSGNNLTGVVTTLTGADASGVTGITTLISAGSNITVETTAGITTITSSAGGGSTANVSTNTLNVVGVSTFKDDLKVDAGVDAKFGSFLSIGRPVSPTGNSSIVSQVGDFQIQSLATNKNIELLSKNDINITVDFNQVGLKVIGGGAVELYHDNVKRLETTTSGVSITDNLIVAGVSTVGVVTGATYFGDASDITSGKWTLGAVGSSHYQFTGPGGLNATADPVIYLARGQSYEFVNNMGAHPFEIRSSNGGSAFSTGVTNNAVSNGTLRFDVPFDAPNSLYYQCTSHAGMGGTIVVYPNLFTV